MLRSGRKINMDALPGGGATLQRMKEKEKLEYSSRSLDLALPLEHPFHSTLWLLRIVQHTVQKTSHSLDNNPGRFQISSKSNTRYIGKNARPGITQFAKMSIDPEIDSTQLTKLKQFCKIVMKENFDPNGHRNVRPEDERSIDSTFCFIQ